MSSTKTTILIVDDDVYILSMMQAMLELENYPVISAGNGKTALRLFKERNPGLVLLDLGLPDIDGYSVCRGIREVSRVPVIMVTAKADIHDKVEGFDVGADDYIIKPFSSRELLARVGAVIRRSAPENRQAS